MFQSAAQRSTQLDEAVYDHQQQEEPQGTAEGGVDASRSARRVKLRNKNRRRRRPDRGCRPIPPADVRRVAGVVEVPAKQQETRQSVGTGEPAVISDDWSVPELKDTLFAHCKFSYFYSYPYYYYYSEVCWRRTLRANVSQM